MVLQNFELNHSLCWAKSKDPYGKKKPNPDHLHLQYILLGLGKMVGRVGIQQTKIFERLALYKMMRSRQFWEHM